LNNGACPNLGLRKIKRELSRAVGAGKGEYTGAKLKVYSCFSRARGTIKCISLFLLN
jgi:hypothetical protein